MNHTTFDLSKLSETEFSDLIKKANQSNLLSDAKKEMNNLIDETREMITGLCNIKVGLFGEKMDLQTITREYLVFIAEEYLARFAPNMSDNDKNQAILLSLDSKAPALVAQIFERERK